MNASSANDAVAGRRRAVIQRLEALQRAGVTHLPKPSAAAIAAAAETSAAEEIATDAAVLANSASEGPAPTATATAQPSSLAGELEAAQRSGRLSKRDRADALEILSQEVARCQLCEELASTRTQTVFGVGNPNARLCFLGEAPGADEDRLGEPFVGRAGQLLNRIIEACTLSRQDVYILNILKCRPPGNRNPSPTESDNCRGFLNRQLEIIAPEFICCLGAVAAQNLLQTTSPIGRMRGKFYEYQGAQVMCTYHPAYLLRNPSAKKDTWEDMKMLMRAMNIAIPETTRKS